MKLLPVQERWCAEIADRLIDGENMIVRGLPATGKTTLLEALEGVLGPSALLVRGRSFSEQDRDAVVLGVRDDLLARVEEHGCAQLLFDDYPHALRRSFGAQVQRGLLHTLVDGPQAREIGAVLAGRWATSMHLSVRGSPLVARSTHLVLPEAAIDDLRAVDETEPGVSTLRSAVGGNCVLLARALRVGGRVNLAAAQEMADQLAQSWVDDLPVDAVEWLREVAVGKEAALPEGYGWEASQPLVVETDGRWRLTDVVSSSDFTERVVKRSVLWPSNWEQSVSQFASLMDGVEDVIWVDRYLLKDPCKLKDYVEALRRHTRTRLRILFASSVVIDELRQNHVCTEAIAQVPDCELRAIAPADYGLLHDRHLAFLGVREDGVVLPTADVILGLAPVGTAMAVHVRLFDRQLHEAAWSRGIPLDRLPLATAKPGPTGQP